MHGKIWDINDSPEYEPQVHPFCRCEIKIMTTVKAGTATIKGIDGADWTVKHKARLPDYYINLEQALKNGWEPGKWFSNFAPDKMFLYYYCFARKPNKSFCVSFFKKRP